MLSFLRCVLCCDDESGFRNHDESSFDYHAIHNVNDTISRIVSPSTIPSAQIATKTQSRNYSTSPQILNTTSYVCNQPKSWCNVYPPSNRVDVNVGSEVLPSNSKSWCNVYPPKNTRTDTHTNFFPKSSTSYSKIVNLPVEVTPARVNLEVTPKKPYTDTHSNAFPKSTTSYSNFADPPVKVTPTRVSLSVGSGVKPKNTHTDTHTNVFPKSISSNSNTQDLPVTVTPARVNVNVGLPPRGSPKVGLLFPTSSSASDASLGSPKSPSVTNKPILSRVVSESTLQLRTSKYNAVETTPLYAIPGDIKGLIKKDILPQILKKPVSPQTYKDYFAALLYAEDYYLEKWDGFEMENVTLKLHEAEINGRKGKSKNKNNDQKDNKIFVEFELDTIPERRPFLLSRDFASVRPSGKKVDPFQGIIYRVVRSNIVLVEFGDDFHAQHYSSCKYNVKFSFNRVCLKRAHQAIAAASDMLFKNFLFPECRPKDYYFSEKNSLMQKLPYNSYKLDSAAINRIITLSGPPAYLVEGPLTVSQSKQLSRTGMVVRDAVVELCQAISDNRILICAPTNSTCDVFMRSLRKKVGDSNIFRANAAFRELDVVPDDILPFCPYKEKENVFLCPSLAQLLKFRVILSTFMSSYRLHNEGIDNGHFTHIFLVDASSAIEPEVLVPLTNLTNSSTKVVVTGVSRNQSHYVRSDIARQNGLRTSYFERLRQSKCYRDLDPESITQLKDDFSSSSSYFR